MNAGRRRAVWKMLAGAALLCTGASLSVAAIARKVSHDGQARKRPNVVLILVDDLGANDIGPYGSRAYATPRLDQFAAQSMVMRQGYAASSVCSPSRAALLTGKNPARLGITQWIPGDYPKGRRIVEPPTRSGLALEEVTLAERFRAAGYRTFLSGKWHLGNDLLGPENQGFDINLGGGHEGSPPSYYSPYRLTHLKDGPAGEYLTDRQASDTISFIEQARNRPFFAFMSLYAVHTPLTPAPDGEASDQARIAKLPKVTPSFIREGEGWTRTNQDNATYASMVRAMDSAVGRVLDALDRLKLADDTIVIFTSDNGGLSTLYPGKDGTPNLRTPTANAPLRAGKGWLFEGGIRVPLIMRVPGGRRGTTNEPVTLLDLTPTLVELAGLNPLIAGETDGDSLTPLLRGQAMPHARSLIWYYPHYHGSGMVPGSAIRSGRWKLVHSYENDADSLFDLRRDPHERNDLARARPTITARMKQSLNAWLRMSGTALPERRQ